MSDFGDRPFVAGSLTGLRAFRVDSLGRLTGVTHQDVWRPGVNEAKCHRDTYVASMRFGSSTYTFHVPSVAFYSTGGGPIYGSFSGQPQGIQASEGTHSDGSAAPTATEPAYVQMTSGKKGRRKGKQHQYTVSDKPAPRNVQPEPTPEPKPEPAHDLVGLKCACGFYAYFDGGNDYLHSEYSDSFRIGAVVEGWGRAVVGSRGFRAEKARVLALIDPTTNYGRDAVLAAKVRSNYNVPVFATEADALREFPLTDPDPITPETAADFWTRPA